MRFYAGPREPYGTRAHLSRSALLYGHAAPRQDRVIPVIRPPSVDEERIVKDSCASTPVREYRTEHGCPFLLVPSSTAIPRPATLA